MSENINTTKRRSAIRIMGSLIDLVKPLLHIMLAAIILGTLGYVCDCPDDIGRTGYRAWTSDRSSRNNCSGGQYVAGICPGKNHYNSHDCDCSASRNPTLCRTVL